MVFTRLALLLPAIAVGAFLALGGCSVTTEGDDDTETILDPPPAGEGVQLVGSQFEVPPGGDVMWCTFINGIDPFEFRRAMPAQGAGGHHLTLYASDAYHPDGEEDCSWSAEFGMDDWKMLVGTPPNSEFQYPQGVGVAFQGGTLILQAHYINTTGETVVANDAMNVWFSGEGEIEHYLGLQPMLNYDIDVAPGESYTTTARCPVTGNYTVAMLFGHQHEMTSGFNVSLVREGGTTTLWEGIPYPDLALYEMGVIYEEGTMLELMPGDEIEWTCSWFNSGQETLGWPREMCVAVFFAYPDDDGLWCEVGGSDE